MINKKGFTLTELLCVIVILGILATIATTGVIKMSQKTNQNLYCAKLELLKAKAEEYGKNHEKELNESNDKYKEYKSITITVEDLIKIGFKADKDGNVINPIDNKSMNQDKIIIYLKDNQINIYINDNNVC